jgi:protein-S-isoprenylcysteine O-methyltransferase Ste14
MSKERIIPPPFYFFSAFLIVLIFTFIVPVLRYKSNWVFSLIGAVLLVLGMGIGFSALLLFRKNKTTLNPNFKSIQLVREGPYKFTRNPMYLSMIINFIGISLLFGSLFGLIITFFLFIVLNYKIIPFEERKIKNTFGRDYQSYFRKVKRWI